jgi:hypothetical protein
MDGWMNTMDSDDGLMGEKKEKRKASERESVKE